MVEVKVTDKAISDIELLANYIAKDSIKFAGITVQNIFEAINYIVDFPEIGRIVPELNQKSIREIILGNYRIIYWINSKTKIDVIAIHNSSRKLTKTYLRKRKK